MAVLKILQKGQYVNNYVHFVADTEEDVKKIKILPNGGSMGNEVYVIEGKFLERVMKNVNFDDYESIQYFQRVLQQSGIIDALIKAGVKDGDTVSVYDIEFDFE